MNKSNFIQTGGYPLKSERLQEMETAYSIFNSLGSLAGNLTILSGCALTGTTVGNGVLYINGEVIEFREANGLGNPSVIIIEEPVMKAFKNGILKQVHTLRYATFGTAETSWPWTSFKRPDPIVVMMARLDVLEKKSAVFQAGGGMVLWNKPANQIPAGWQEVINWRGRMPVGLDVTQPEFNTMGKPGGEKSKTLSVSEMPKHSFEYKDSYFISNDFSNNFISGREDTGKVYYGTNSADNDNRYLYYKNRTTEQIGGDQAFSIMNPYRVVLFIEYIG